MPPLPRSSRRTDALPSGNILTSTSRLMPRWPLLVSPTPIQYSSWLISVGNSTLATALRPPVELLKQHTKHRTTELGSQTPGSHHGRVQHRQRQQLAGRSTAALGVDHPGTAQGSQTTGDPRGPVQHQRPRRGRPGVSAVPRGVSHRATTRCNRITGDPRGPVQHQRPRRGRPGGLAMARGVSHRATKRNHTFVGHDLGPVAIVGHDLGPVAIVGHDLGPVAIVDHDFGNSIITGRGGHLAGHSR